MKINIITIFIISQFLCSCGLLMGVKKPKELTINEIKSTQKRLQIPDSLSFVLNKTYVQYLKSCPQSEKKNHLQPLQIIFFNKYMKIQSYFVNCHAQGFPLLNWNRDNILDSFSHKTLTPIDSCISLSSILLNLRGITTISKYENQSVFQNYDFICLIFWNKFMFKQSHNLLNQYRKSLYKNSSLKILTLFINNDNLFYDL